MTTDTIKLYTKYNSHANSLMNKIISQLTPSEWEKEFGGYYKSVKSLCSHLYTADFNWLKRFGSVRAFNFLNNRVFEKVYARGDIPFNEINEYLDKRNELDRAFESFAEELTDDDFGKTLRYKSFKGEDQSRNLGGVLLHMLNHQTHHRGMISLYLELLGRENDFANLIVLV